MSFFRIFIVGFCIACFSIGVFMKPSGHYEQPHCANEPIIENASSGQPILGTQPKANANRIDYEKKAHEISCSDLKAQWLAADTAHRTFWITVMGLALIAFTLYETLSAGKLLSKQNEIALDAAIAAQDSVEVTREIGKKQVKAYVSIRNAVFLIDKSGLPSIQMTFKNTGSSPAMDIEIQHASYRVHTGYSDEEKGVHVRQTFSGSASGDEHAGVPILDDLMAGEEKLVDDLRILHGNVLMSLQTVFDFMEVLKKDGASAQVECYCTLKYTDVFNDIYTLPLAFGTYSQDVSTRRFDLTPRKRISAEAVKKLWEDTE